MIEAGLLVAEHGIMISASLCTHTPSPHRLIWREGAHFKFYRTDTKISKDASSKRQACGEARLVENVCTHACLLSVRQTGKQNENRKKKRRTNRLIRQK